jgi:hypothetical protein
VPPLLVKLLLLLLGCVSLALELHLQLLWCGLMLGRAAMGQTLQQLLLEWTLVAVGLLWLVLKADCTVGHWAVGRAEMALVVAAVLVRRPRLETTATTAAAS